MQRNKRQIIKIYQTRSPTSNAMLKPQRCDYPSHRTKLTSATAFC